jgi:hypothetical protein
MARFCFENGMFPNEAAEVVEMTIKRIEKLRPSPPDWDGPANQYPPAFHKVLSFWFADTAVKWIDENCPDAFYRPIFDALRGGEGEND